MRLAGKRALITGGTSGIGLATAELFIENGAKVAVTGRNPKAINELQERFGSDHLVVQSDVSDLQQIEKLMSLVKTKFGGLDILFANAGVPGAAPVGKITEELYDRTATIMPRPLNEKGPVIRGGAWGAV
jgi:NAD(P)-dependent dehydrogenase (short-subunit alcohol dehydrogenase family)